MRIESVPALELSALLPQAGEGVGHAGALTGSGPAAYPSTRVDIHRLKHGAHHA